MPKIWFVDKLERLLFNFLLNTKLFCSTKIESEFFQDFKSLFAHVSYHNWLLGQLIEEYMLIEELQRADRHSGRRATTDHAPAIHF